MSQRLCPAKQRLDARQQLRDAEGLGEIVIGPDLEPQHPIQFAGLGGEHQDGDVVGSGAQPLADRQAIHAGQHQVQDHQIIAGLRKALYPFRAVTDDIRLALDITQMHLHQPRDIGVVFYDQDLAHRVAFSR